MRHGIMWQQRHGLFERAYRSLKSIGLNVFDTEQIVDVGGRIGVFREHFL